MSTAAATTPPSQTLSVEAAAAALGVSTWALYTAIRDGRSPVAFVRVGRRIVIPRPALERLLAGDRENNSPSAA